MEYLKDLHYIQIIFLIHIIDLYSVFNKAATIHFPDDTQLSYASKKLSTTESKINYELKNLSECLRSHKLFLSSRKSELVIFHSKERTI